MERKTGVLLHITSLPSRYGIGTLGKEAYKFVNWLKLAGMKIWQILPLGPTSYGDSPYQSSSTFGLNHYLIDINELISKKLLSKDECKELYNIDVKKVSYERMFNAKTKLLKLAYTRFNKDDPSFISFANNIKFSDYAVFMTLKELNDYKPWYEWKDNQGLYTKELEAEIKLKHRDIYLFWLWTQFEFLNEWMALRKYANNMGIKIMGDIPIYVAYDSVDVWKYPYLFDLNEDLSLKYVAGCIGDRNGNGGQLWGNPLYNWKNHKKDGYKFWNDRISEAFKLYDILRIDHFRGFDRYCALFPNQDNKTFGIWLDGPSFDLFKDKLDYNIVAENLGYIDDGVKELMKKTGYAGMTVMTFGFNSNIYNEHLPSMAPENNVIYTGTHDNDTFLGHILSMNNNEKIIFRKALKRECEYFNIPFDSNKSGSKYMLSLIIELGYASKSNMCIFPIQDLLYKNSSSRMNTPNTLSANNWSYRCLPTDFSASLANKLHELAIRYNRS